MKSINNLKQRLAARLEERVKELENEIKQLESVRCGREEYKENVRKIKILKLRKGGAEKAITKYKADLA
jgi:cell shape-determining protein MreC